MAKLSSASVRLVQKMNRPMKDGTYPIYLVVCFHGRMEKKTGVSCLSKYWDAKRECVKGGCTNAPLLNKILNDLKGKVIERKNQCEFEGKVYTPALLLQDAEISFNGASNVFKRLMDKLIDDRRLKYGTIRSYDYTYSKLCEFLGRKDFIVDELVLGVVKDFAVWLEKNNIKINTIKRVLSCVAAVWNYGIQRKIVSGENYPFVEFKYTQKYKEVPRDYYLEKSHIVRLKQYWMDLCIEWVSEKMWRYKDGVEERLLNRCSKEFGILWFLMCYKLNGSSPFDVALIRPQDCKRVYINNEDYWAIDIRRKKTDREVHIRMKRDIFCICGFEYLMMFSKHYVFPILHWKEGCSDKYLNEQSHKVSDKAIRWVRKAFEDINLDIAKNNALNGFKEPLIESEKVVMYTCRHSFATQYLSTPNATVNGLASLLSRSPNTISTYVKQLTRDEDIAEMVEDMPI